MYTVYGKYEVSYHENVTMVQLQSKGKSSMIWSLNVFLRYRLHGKHIYFPHNNLR